MCAADWQESQERGQESLSQAIGRLAWERRLDGLLVPSAADRPRGVNLVAYPDHASAGWAEIYNVEELPPDETGALGK
jgi:hypothetical protein